MENKEKATQNNILADRSNTALEYTLTKDEVTSALYLAGKLKKRKIITIIEVAICTVLFIIALINVIVDFTYAAGYIVMAAAITVIVVVLIFPEYEKKKTVENAYKTANAKTIITPLPDKIKIKVPQSGANWEIRYDDVRGVRSDDTVYVIFLKDTRIVVVPKRAIDTEKKQAAFMEAKQALTAPPQTEE